MTDHQSSSLRQVFLARHGQSLANLNKQISGQIDSPLSLKGIDQSLWLNEVLQHEALSGIYTSTLSRAFETARPTAVSHQLQIQALDGLKEMHFGIYQGKAVENTDKAVSNMWLDHSHYKNAGVLEGGETYSDFEHRVITTIQSVLANSSGNLLIVGHRNTNEVILAKLLNLGSASALSINVKNKYLYKIELAMEPRVTTIRLGGEHHGQHYPGLKDD